MGLDRRADGGLEQSSSIGVEPAAGPRLRAPCQLSDEQSAERWGSASDVLGPQGAEIAERHPRELVEIETRPNSRSRRTHALPLAIAMLGARRPDARSTVATPASLGFLAAPAADAKRPGATRLNRESLRRRAISRMIAA